MGKESSMHGGEVECIQDFGGKARMKETTRARHRGDNIKIDLREDGAVWTGLIWLRIGTSGGSCE
jgi:hypothetical protein